MYVLKGFIRGVFSKNIPKFILSFPSGFASFATNKE